MKQYDKIYIPDESDGIFLITRERMEDSAPIHVTYASEEESVIVLTIEELREVWDSAQDRANALASGFPEDTMIFEAYLQSKGIQLNEK